jgi:hypothetical protein
VLAASGSPADRFPHLLVGQRPMGMGASSELSPKIERNLLLEQSLPACAGPRFEGRHIDRIGRCTHSTPRQKGATRSGLDESGQIRLATVSSSYANDKRPPVCHLTPVCYLWT